MTHVAATPGASTPAVVKKVGFVFAITPPDECVIVNLSALYADHDFLGACERHKDEIQGFEFGIGLWANRQQEVIIEVPSINTDSVFAMGGFSSSREDIARQFFRRKPSARDLEYLDLQLEKLGNPLGARWIMGAANERVKQRLRDIVRRKVRERPDHRRT